MNSKLEFKKYTSQNGNIYFGQSTIGDTSKRQGIGLMKFLNGEFYVGE